jgi:hypothetical protein
VGFVKRAWWGRPPGWVSSGRPVFLVSSRFGVLATRGQTDMRGLVTCRMGFSAGTASLSTERERSQSWWAGCS